MPIGLELYSVRTGLAKDLPGTVRAVAKQGYQVVEFYGPYYSWTVDYAKEVRKTSGRCGPAVQFHPQRCAQPAAEGLPKAIELNRALGSKYIVMASAGRPEGLDGWKGVAETLTQAAETLRSAGLRTGYHNHKAEFVPMDGKRPIEVMAANTPKDVMLQFDVGTCVEGGSDPVAWINANPAHHSHALQGLGAGGRAEGLRGSVRRRRFAVEEGFSEAAEKGGVEYYLIEQEGSRFRASRRRSAASPTTRRCGVRGCHYSRQGPAESQAESRLQPGLAASRRW